MKRRAATMRSRRGDFICRLKFGPSEEPRRVEVEHDGGRIALEIRCYDRIWELKREIGAQLGLPWDTIAIRRGGREIGDGEFCGGAREAATHEARTRPGLDAEAKLRWLCERLSLIKRRVDTSLNATKDIALVFLRDDDDDHPFSSTQDGEILVYEVRTMTACALPERFGWELSTVRGASGVDLIKFSEDDPHVIMALWWGGVTKRYRADPSGAQVVLIEERPTLPNDRARAGDNAAASVDTR